MKVASRLSIIQESATLAVTERAAAMRREGIDVVGLGAGEPDFDTPEHVKDAAIRAIREGFTKYTPVAGIPELREAVAARFKKDHGLAYDPRDILVSTGSKHSIFNALHACCDPGDEVVFFSPYWVSYPEMVKVAGAVPVAVACREEEGFRPDLSALERAITPRTRALILNTPNNPTGACIDRADLEAIAALAQQRDLWVISDEIYEKIVYDGFRHVPFPSLSADAFRRTVLVNGLSKSFAMTGWRLGYAACPARDVIAAATRLQGQSTTNVASIVQRAGVAALTQDDGFLAGWVAQFDERRRELVARLRKIPGVACTLPRGAFYVLADVGGLFGKRAQGKVLRTGADVATALLEQGHVAAVPGEPFGAQHHVRFSYATSPAKIREGMERMERWVAGLEG